MPATEAEKAAIKRYKEKSYRRVPLEMKKEEYDELKAACDKIGEKVNTFIRAAIRQRLNSIQAEEQQIAELNFSMTEN